MRRRSRSIFDYARKAELRRASPHAGAFTFKLLVRQHSQPCFPRCQCLSEFNAVNYCRHSATNNSLVVQERDRLDFAHSTMVECQAIRIGFDQWQSPSAHFTRLLVFRSLLGKRILSRLSFRCSFSGFVALFQRSKQPIRIHIQRSGNASVQHSICDFTTNAFVTSWSSQKRLSTSATQHCQ